MTPQLDGHVDLIVNVHFNAHTCSVNTCDRAAVRRVDHEVPSRFGDRVVQLCSVDLHLFYQALAGSNLTAWLNLNLPRQERA